MDRPDREAAWRRGQRKLDAMRRRTGQLRRRVAATAVVGFVLLWTVVFARMATGNDPALGTGAPAHTAAAKERPAPDPKRRSLLAATERAEAERIEAERWEAEARELEELEAVTTSQS